MKPNQTNLNDVLVFLTLDLLEVAVIEYRDFLLLYILGDKDPNTYCTYIYNKEKNPLSNLCKGNEEVRNTIRHAIGPYEDLITTVRKPN